MESGKEVIGFDADGRKIPGLQMAPKAYAIMHQVELDKPDMFRNNYGIKPQGDEKA